MYKLTTLFAVLLLLTAQVFCQTQTINGDFSFTANSPTESWTAITACGEDVEITVTTNTNQDIDGNLIKYFPDPTSLETEITITFDPAVNNPRLALGDFDFQPNSYFEVIDNIGSTPAASISVSQYESFPEVEMDGNQNVFYMADAESETNSWLNWDGDNISSLSFRTTFPGSSWHMRLLEYEFECFCKDVVISESQSICTESPALETTPISVEDGGAGGTWSSSDGFIENPTATSTNILGISSFGVVDIFWEDNCNGLIYETQIDFLSAPDADLDVLPSPILCEDATGTVFVTPQVDGSIYSWNLLCDTQIEEISSNPEFEIPEDHVGNICLTITYPNGCIEKAKIKIMRKDCSCEDGLYPGMQDQSVCTADFPFCTDVPDGFFLTSAALDNNELIILDDSELCVPVAGTYVLELQHLASGCTVDDIVVITEDTTCCTLMPDFNSINFSGICGLYQFVDMSSGNATTDILGYNWNFGDGHTSTMQNPPIHFYTNEGTYDVTLSVTGIDTQGNCCTESVTQQIDVDCACSNQANFTTSIENCIVTLSDASTSGFGSINYNWQWDMGDGTLLFGQTVNHTYANSGTYDIELTTTAHDDNEVCESSTTQSITVNCGPTIPCDVKPDFLLQLYSSIAVFMDNSEVGNGTTILGYNWTMDGVNQGSGNSFALSPIPPPGQYTICLDVIAESDGECCIKSICKDYNFANSVSPDDSGNNSQPRSTMGSDDSSLQLFPNPSNGNLNINVTGWQAEHLNVEIYDIAGSSVMKPFTSAKVNFDLDVSHLNAGVYLIKVESKEGVLVERLIVK